MAIELLDDAETLDRIDVVATIGASVVDALSDEVEQVHTQLRRIRDDLAELRTEIARARQGRVPRV